MPTFSEQLAEFRSTHIVNSGDSVVRMLELLLMGEAEIIELLTNGGQPGGGQPLIIVVEGQPVPRVTLGANGMASIALAMTDEQQADIPITGADAAGNAVPGPVAGLTVITPADPTIAVVSVLPDGSGINVTSVNAPAGGTSDGATTATLSDGSTPPNTIDVNIAISTSAVTGLVAGAPTITAR